MIYVHDVYLTDTLEEIKETTKHMKSEFEIMSWLYINCCPDLKLEIVQIKDWLINHLTYRDVNTQ